jgi:hypothetical protein
MLREGIEESIDLKHTPAIAATGLAVPAIITA